MFGLAPIAMLYWPIKTKQNRKETEFVLRRLLIGCTYVPIQTVPDIQPDQQNSTNSVNETYPPEQVYFWTMNLADTVFP